MFRLALCLAAVAALTWTVAIGIAAPSPKKLYTALLTTRYPDSQLPSGFFSAKVGITSPSKAAKKLHVVGEIEVDTDGPDPADGLLYAIFPNRADAKADLAHSAPTRGHMHIVPGGVPGVLLPGHMWTGSVTGKNAFGKTVTNGVTSLAVQKGNVLLGVVTTSTDNPQSGNVPGAIALLKSALRHLDAIEKKITRKH